MADYTLRHTYERGCPQVLAVARDGDQIAMALVELTGCPDDIVATVTADPADPTGHSVILEWDNGDQGTVAIQWDGAAASPGHPAAGTEPRAYTPEQAGPHSVAIQDEDDPNRRLVLDFEIPMTPPVDDLTLRIEPGDATGYTARAIWGPSDEPEPPGELAVTVTPAANDDTGYTATASWRAEQ